MATKLLRFLWAFLMTTAFCTYPVSVFSQTFASNGQSPVREHVQMRPLRDALLKLREDYKVDIVFDDKLVTDRSVDSHLLESDLDFEQKLTRILHATGLRYKKTNKKIYLVLAPKTDRKAGTSSPARTDSALGVAGTSPPRAEDGHENRMPAKPVLTVSGTVTDENNVGLPGVSVNLKGTTTGTSTNKDGNYSLSVPDESRNGTLVFSSIGYTSEEVPIGGRTNINVALLPDIKSLSEIVVVGYGTQKREDVTGSVASIRGEELKKLPVSSVDQRLAGQIAGVQVNNVTGAPGGGTSIKIRGSGSIGAGDQPLFVIDGFPLADSFGQLNNPLAFLNPDDIESITVLKDASSTAIYGSRGSNGVVMITTKKAKTGVTRVDFNSYLGWQQVPQRGRPAMLNAREFAQFRRDIITDDFAARGLVATDADIPAEFRNPEQYGTGTNWYNEVLRTAPQQNHNLTISKGTENFRTAVSMAYFNQEGVIRYTGFERYSIRANFEGDLSKRIKVGLNIAPTYSIQRSNDYEREFWDVLNRSLWLSPLVPFRDASGALTPYVASPGMFAAPNPILSLREAGGRTTTAQVLANFNASYEITNGLTLRYIGGIDYRAAKFFIYRPASVGNLFAPPPTYIANSNTTYNNSLNWLSEILLTYDKKIGTDHRIETLLGYTAQKQTADQVGIFATPYPDDNVRTINAAATIFGGQDIQEWSLMSYLARANYSFRDRYLLTATIRADGSSRFGQDKRFGTFPSVAVGWRLSEESFLKGINLISDLKIRASYGLAGNNNIGNYTYIAGVAPNSAASSPAFGLPGNGNGSNSYVFGGQLASGQAVNSLANPVLTWEQASQLDIGLDAGLLNNRITFTADYYRRITQGMLLNSLLPLSSGFTNTIINSGRVLNQGFEFAVNTQNTTGKLKWRTSGNIAFNRNRVLALNANNDPIFSGRSGEGSFTHKTEVGQPIGQFYGYVVEGIYRNAEELARFPRHVTSVEGSIRYRDVDGNGVIEPVKDFAVIGNAQPDFIYGITNTLNYLNFDLSILINGTQGGQVFKTANQYLHNIDGIFNVDRQVLNRWRSPQQPGDGRTPTTNGSRVIYRDVNSGWVENGSFLSVRNITLGYTFPTALVSRSKFVQTARLYASVQNAFLFTRYSGSNPEVSRNGSSVLTPGMDFGNYPLPRIITVGLNASF